MICYNLNLLKPQSYTPICNLTLRSFRISNYRFDRMPPEIILEVFFASFMTTGIENKKKSIIHKLIDPLIFFKK